MWVWGFWLIWLTLHAYRDERAKAKALGACQGLLTDLDLQTRQYGRYYYYSESLILICGYCHDDYYGRYYSFILLTRG